jgi:outer membrane protein assembly factor BamB
VIVIAFRLVLARALGIALGWSVVVAVGAVAAQDWSQWLGPTRDGVLPASLVPAEWPRELRQVWEVEVGEGYSSPVTDGGLVFVHGRRDPDEVVTAVDLESGGVRWRMTYPAPFTKNSYAVERAKGPHATPLVADGRLFTLGGAGVLSAWSVSDGTLLWRNDYSSAVDTSKLFCGTAASPLYEAERLVVQVGSDVHGGRVLALDPATGAERWVWSGEGPGYASPIAITVEGTRQIVTFTNGSLVGLEASTGRLLWSVPFPDEWHENIVTPVFTGALLVVSGTRQATRAYRLSSGGGPWRATEAWSNGEIAMYMSTPLLVGDTLYGLTNKRKGELFALDASTGAVRWKTQGREGEHATLLRAGDEVVVLTDQARLAVFEPRTDGPHEVRRYDVAESATWAAPVALRDGWIVRDASSLRRWSLAGDGD